MKRQCKSMNSCRPIVETHEEKYVAENITEENIPEENITEEDVAENTTEDEDSDDDLTISECTSGNILTILCDKTIINIAKNLMDIVKSEDIFADVVLIDIHEWNNSRYRIEENHYFFVFLPHLLEQELPYHRTFIYLMEQNFGGN